MRPASALQPVDLGLFSGRSSRGSASACLALGAAPAASARSSSGETPMWSAEVRLRAFLAWYLIRVERTFVRALCNLSSTVQINLAIKPCLITKEIHTHCVKKSNNLVP